MKLASQNFTFDEVSFPVWEPFQPLLLLPRREEKLFCQESLTKFCQEKLTRKKPFFRAKISIRNPNEIFC
jgi:hypothetical protein